MFEQQEAGCEGIVTGAKEELGILRQVLGFRDHQVAEIHDSGALDPRRKQAAE